jgi:orotidine-5'-phosphate decarboxylase
MAQVKKEPTMPDGAALTPAPANRDLPADMKDRLIVALDRATVAEAEQVIEQLDGVVSFFKIGLWLQFAEGVDRLMSALIAADKKLFLDAKMYDVPQTVGQAVKAAVKRGASFVTVHGDEAIIRAAVAAKAGSDLKIFAVTVLTSLDDAALHKMGYRLPAKELVLLRTQQAAVCGCDGIIASANDDPDQIRALADSPRLLIATPGIRLSGGDLHDQKRVATPREAIENGADYLVVGRPIVDDLNPRAAAVKVIEEMRLGEQQRKANRKG